MLFMFPLMLMLLLMLMPMPAFDSATAKLSPLPSACAGFCRCDLPPCVFTLLFM